MNEHMNNPALGCVYTSERICSPTELFDWLSVDAEGTLVISDLAAAAGLVYLPLSGLTELRRIPDDVFTSLRHLIVNGCALLGSIPKGLRLTYISCDGCTSLTEIPEYLGSKLELVCANNCLNLESLPDYMPRLQRLICSGNPKLKRLPAYMNTVYRLEINGNHVITELPSTSTYLKLEFMEVVDCPNLRSLSNAFMPKLYRLWHDARLANKLPCQSFGLVELFEGGDPRHHGAFLNGHTESLERAKVYKTIEKKRKAFYIDKALGRLNDDVKRIVSAYIG